MNNDLISREALKKAIEKYRNLNCVSTSTIIGVRNVMYLIDNAPTVDMNTELSVAYLKGRRQGQPDVRPQGEWIEKEETPVCEDCMHRLTSAAENMEFAKWVTKMIFDNGVEDFDFDLFSELACRKLEQMGLVEKVGSRWMKKGDTE